MLPLHVVTRGFLGRVEIVGRFLALKFADDPAEKLHRLEAAFTRVASDLQLYPPIGRDNDIIFSIWHKKTGQGGACLGSGYGGRSVFPVAHLEADGAVRLLLILDYDELAGAHLVF